MTSAFGFDARPIEIAPGVAYFPGLLDRAAQEALLADVRAILAAAPPFRPRMPRTGKPFSVKMSNCGALGWVSDENGYRYQPTHPETGRAWPAMPPRLVAIWASLAPLCPAAGGLPHQSLRRQGQDGLAPGSGRAGTLCAGRVAFSRRQRAFPARRARAQRFDALDPPSVGRCDHVRRAGAARLPRDRSDRAGLLDPAWPRAGESI